MTSNHSRIAVLRQMASTNSRLFEIDDAIDEMAEAIFATVSIENTQVIISTLQKLLKKHEKEMAEAGL